MSDPSGGVVSRGYSTSLNPQQQIRLVNSMPTAQPMATAPSYSPQQQQQPHFASWLKGPFTSAPQGMIPLQGQNRIQPDYSNAMNPAAQLPSGGMVGIEPWQRRPMMGGEQWQPRPQHMNFMNQLQNWFQQIPQQNQQARQGIMDSNEQTRQGIMQQNQAFRDGLGHPVYRAMPVQGSYGQHPGNKPYWGQNAMSGGY